MTNGLPVTHDSSSSSGLSSEPVLDPTVTNSQAELDASAAAAAAPAAPAAAPDGQPAPAAPADPAAPAAQPDLASQEGDPADIDRVDPSNYQQAGAIVPSHTDPRVNSVESLLAEKGITNEQAMQVFGEALNSMDFTKIDKAGLEGLVGKASANLIMSNLEAYNADVVRAEEQALSYAHTKFGGKDAFDAAVKWMNNNLNHPSLSAELVAIKQMCAQGGAPMRLALENLQSRYNASGEAQPNIIQPDGAAGGTPSLQPFESKKEYAEAMQQAFWSGDKAKIDALNARFAASPKLHSKS